MKETARDCKLLVQRLLFLCRLRDTPPRACQLVEAGFFFALTGYPILTFVFFQHHLAFCHFFQPAAQGVQAARRERLLSQAFDDGVYPWVLSEARLEPWRDLAGTLWKSFVAALLRP